MLGGLFKKPRPLYSQALLVYNSLIYTYDYVYIHTVQVPICTELRNGRTENYT